MNTNIEFRALNGANVVGGSFFELRGPEGFRPLYLDAGLPLFENPGGQPKALDLDLFRLARDPLAGCRELRAQGHLPQGTGLFLDEEPRLAAAVVISHAHMDHWGLLPFMHPRIPVLSSPVTRVMIDSQLAWRGLALPKRLWVTPDFGQGNVFGTWMVKLHRVDHSVPGASAVEVLGLGRQRLLYTGDLRGHGSHPETLEALVGAVGKPLHLLVSEGTNVGQQREPAQTEDALAVALGERLAKITGFATLCASGLHLDRLRTVEKAAAHCGRELVLDLYGAWLLEQAERAGACIGLQKRPRVLWTKTQAKNFFRMQPGNEEDLRQRFGGEREVKFQDLKADPKAYLVQIRGSSAKDSAAREAKGWASLPSIDLHIHSLWKGYLGSPSNANFEMYLASKGAVTETWHSGGHAMPEDLAELARRLQPKRLALVHSFHPELGLADLDGIELVDAGQPIALPAEPLAADEISGRPALRERNLEMLKEGGLNLKQAIARDKVNYGYSEQEIRALYTASGYEPQEIEEALNSWQMGAAEEIAALSKWSADPVYRHLLLNNMLNDGETMVDYLQFMSEMGLKDDEIMGKCLKRGFLEEEVDGALRAMKLEADEAWPGPGTDWDALLREVR